MVGSLNRDGGGRGYQGCYKDMAVDGGGGNKDVFPGGNIADSLLTCAGEWDRDRRWWGYRDGGDGGGVGVVGSEGI